MITETYTDKLDMILLMEFRQIYEDEWLEFVSKKGLIKQYLEYKEE